MDDYESWCIRLRGAIVPRNADAAYLVEKHVFAVTALGREGLELAGGRDAVLEAELLPELGADCLAAC